MMEVVLKKFPSMSLYAHIFVFFLSHILFFSHLAQLSSHSLLLTQVNFSVIHVSFPFILTCPDHLKVVIFLV